MQSVDLQMNPLNNNLLNSNQKIYQNFYYINNPYKINEILYTESSVEKYGNYKENINNTYKRGIVNNIIGAFFIEELKEKRKREIR